MNFLKKNIWTLVAVLVVGLLFATPDAFADTVFDTAHRKAKETFKAVKATIFIVGGFGLVALAFFAVFGKLKWTWFASLAVGLAILAAAGAIIDYATYTDGTAGASGNSMVAGLGDTLKGDGISKIPGQ